MEFIRWSNPDASFYRQLYELLTGSADQVKAFGLEWLGERLMEHPRHDHRLDTAVSMLDRHRVVADNEPPGCFDVIADLSDVLADDELSMQKMQRD